MSKEKITPSPPSIPVLKENAAYTVHKKNHPFQNIDTPTTTQSIKWHSLIYCNAGTKFCYGFEYGIVDIMVRGYQ